MYAAIEINRSGAAGVDVLALTTPFLSLSLSLSDGGVKGENERELGFGFRVRVEDLGVWWKMQGRWRREREAIFGFRIGSW